MFGNKTQIQYGVKANIHKDYNWQEISEKWITFQIRKKKFKKYHIIKYFLFYSELNLTKCGLQIWNNDILLIIISNIEDIKKCIKCSLF